ncbi:MAG TPA: sensor histidine kinase [Stellaceae bacterium]|nr:sensor histidine kinase [Stellaceae bacterium]
MRLHAHRHDNGVTVTLSDTGPGIPRSEYANVFRRFYRLETSRTTPGNGLGLSLVAAIAALHGISIELADNEPGLRLTLELPGAIRNPCRSVTKGRISVGEDKLAG